MKNLEDYLKKAQLLDIICLSNVDKKFWTFVHDFCKSRILIGCSSKNHVQQFKTFQPHLTNKQCPKVVPFSGNLLSFSCTNYQALSPVSMVQKVPYYTWIPSSTHLLPWSVCSDTPIGHQVWWNTLHLHQLWNEREWVLVLNCHGIKFAIVLDKA